ncbi:MAG: hypothetical protein AB7T49_19530 [Oligoflexales bacterium]
MLTRALLVSIGASIGFTLFGWGAVSAHAAEIKYCGCDGYNDAFIVFNSEKRTWGNYDSKSECLNALAQNPSCSTTIEMSQTPNIYCGCDGYNDAYIIFNNEKRTWGNYDSSQECLDALSKNLSCSPKYCGN